MDAIVYTCPMHPEVRENKPGQCPKCGMKLEEKLPSGPRRAHAVRCFAEKSGGSDSA